MVLYRNIRARDLLEIFLVSAVTSLLLVRFYLYLAGYPQLGGGNFHIAHMLWGGLLMLAAIVILLSFLGVRAQKLAALVGGLGFGVFVDEIGKFITSDNNYFFRPAVGIIYAIFVVLYLAITFITRDTKFSSLEYQLNALAELEEALAHDMDKTEKARVRTMLAKANQKNLITIELKKLLNGIETVPQPPKGRLARLFARIDSLYQNFWYQRKSHHFVRIFFVAEAGLIFVGVLLTLITHIDDIFDLINGRVDYGTWLLIGEFASAFMAGLLAIWGAYLLKRSRLDALEMFRRATLINLFLTEFFTFSRIEFAALPGFVLNLALIIIIGYAIQQERRLQRKV